MGSELAAARRGWPELHRLANVPKTPEPARAAQRAERLSHPGTVAIGSVRRLLRRTPVMIPDLLRRLLKFLEGHGWPHIKTHYDWSIGIYEGASPLDLRAPPDAPNPVLTAADVTDATAEFVADPFVVRHDERWHMFFEVLNGTTGRGEIGWGTSDDFRSWRYQRIVLRESFHVSYPFVFQAEGEWLMIPESAEAAGVRLYRADPFPTDWRYDTTILAGEFADHALVRHANLWWLFVGKNCGSRPQSSDTLGALLRRQLARTLAGSRPKPTHHERCAFQPAGRESHFDQERIAACRARLFYSLWQASERCVDRKLDDDELSRKDLGPSIAHAQRRSLASSGHAPPRCARNFTGRMACRR